MDEFYNGELVRMFPDLAKRTSNTLSSAPVTPPSRARLSRAAAPPQATAPLQATCILDVPKRVSRDDVEQFVRNPSTLVGTRFVHSPPQDHEQGNKSTWRVISYIVREGDQGVEHEYRVLLEAFGGDPLPMDEAEVRYLLQYSTFAM